MLNNDIPKNKVNIGFIRRGVGITSSYTVDRELNLFQACNNFNIVLITGLINGEAVNTNESVRTVKINKILPDFIYNIFFRPPLYGPVSFVNLKNLEDSLMDIDIINTIELYSFVSGQCAHIAKKLNKRLVVSVWETLPNMPLHWYVSPHSRNVRIVIKQADIFLAYTKRAANYLRSLSVPEEKIIVVYPVIDLQKFSPLNSINNHDTFRILFNSRLVSEKGFIFLLQAFLQLFSEDQNIELWICGDYKNSKEGIYAYKLAQKYHYPIKFLGYLNFNDMPKIYRNCDVLCLPSIDRRIMGVKVWEEQFGFVLAEAMACGLAIIASNSGAIPEVIGENNLVVKQKSAQDLYIALKELAEKRDLCREIGKKNRLRAEKMFNIDKQTETLKKLFRIV